jgi:hypothetical protein
LIYSCQFLFRHRPLAGGFNLARIYLNEYVTGMSGLNGKMKNKKSRGAYYTPALWFLQSISPSGL